MEESTQNKVPDQAGKKRPEFQTESLKVKSNATNKGRDGIIFSGTSNLPGVKSFRGLGIPENTKYFLKNHFENLPQT